MTIRIIQPPRTIDNHWLSVKATETSWTLIQRYECVDVLLLVVNWTNSISLVCCKLVCSWMFFSPDVEKLSSFNVPYKRVNEGECESCIFCYKCKMLNKWKSNVISIERSSECLYFDSLANKWFIVCFWLNYCRG